LLLLPFLGAGCGVLFTHGPPAGHEKLTTFRCTKIVAAPVLDVLLASVSVALSIKSAENQPSYDPHSNEILAVALLRASVLGVSAAVGFDKVSKCVAARRQLAERKARAPGGSAPTNVQRVEITPAIDTLKAGEHIQLVARALNASGGVFLSKSFRWSSSNDSIASVSDTGLVIARATGTVVIAANADNVIGTASVVVQDDHAR
jgi:uncharacterized protein YjdB